MKPPFLRYTNGEHTLEVFDAMCKVHDLTHEFSDDFEVWKRGHEELKQISAAAIELGPAAKAVWNKHVREKLLHPHAGNYLW